MTLSLLQNLSHRLLTVLFGNFIVLTHYCVNYVLGKRAPFHVLIAVDINLVKERT